MNKETILLIQPRPKGMSLSIRFIPHGLLSLAAALQDSYNVIIINRSIDVDDSHLDNIITSNRVICVGFSVMTGGSIIDALHSSKYLKYKYPDIPVVWGGWHPTQVPFSIMPELSIDYLVQGEGEISFKRLLEHLNNSQPMDDIPGVGYRANGIFHLNPPSQPLDINQFPSKPYGLLNDIEPYIIPNWIPGSQRCISLESSRGCPYGCSFCEISSHFHKSYRSLSPEKLFLEISNLIDKFNIDGINFCDANFFLDIERVRKFSKLILKHSLNFSWGASGTIMQFSKIRDSDLYLFKQAGLTSVAFGVESASERVRRDILNKKFTNIDLARVAEQTERIGIQMKIYMMLGLPGETVQDSLQTVDFTLELIEKHSNLATSGSMNIYTPFPKTPLSQKAEELGYRFPDTLEGFSSLTMRGSTGLIYLDRSHYKMLKNISLMSVFLCMTKKNIFFTGLKRAALSLARRFYLFRLKKHIFFSTPDLYVLRKFFRA